MKTNLITREVEMGAGAISFLIGVATLVLYPSSAHAYLGPGAGLSMIGTLIAVVGLVILSFLGLLILPLRILIKSLRKKRDAANATRSDQSDKTP